MPKLDSSSYQEAAVAALSSEAAPANEDIAPSEESAPEPEAAIVETEEEPDGHLEPVEGEKKAEAAPAKEEPPKKDWEKIAKEKAAARVKAAEEAEAPKMKALLAAAKAGDAMSLLAAAGIPWSAAAQQVIDGGKVEAKKQEQQSEPESDIQKELREIKAELNARKYTEAKGKLMDKIKEAATASAPFVAGLEAEEEVFEFLDRYYRETGEQPGETLEESIEIACEAVEQKLRKKGEKWKNVLTNPGSGNTRNGSKQVSPSAASNRVAKTLTNDTGAGPRSVNPAKPKVAKTEQDYREETLKVLLGSSPE